MIIYKILKQMKINSESISLSISKLNIFKIIMEAALASFPEKIDKK